MAENPEVNDGTAGNESEWVPSAADVPAWQDPVEAEWEEVPAEPVPVQASVSDAFDDPRPAEPSGGELLPPRDPFEPRPGGDWVTSRGPAEPEPEPADEGKEPWSKDNEKARKKELKQEQKEYKAHKWATRPRRQAAKIGVILLIVGLIVGAIAGAVGLNAYHNSHADDVILGMFEDEHELVTVSETVSVEETMVKPAEFFGNKVSFIESECLVRYVGEVKIAVDMSTAEVVGRQGDTITVSLDQPYIASNTPDMEKSGIIYVNDNVFNRIDMSETNQFMAACKAKVEEAAHGNEALMERARANTQDELGKLFSAALGKHCTVEVYWR